MAYRDEPSDEDEADLDERDDPDASDMDDDGDDDPETLPCPYCGKPVSEEAEICPHCHSFISFAEMSGGRSWWMIAAAVAVLAAMLLGLVFMLAG